MIHLITGTPGSGKTLWTLDHLYNTPAYKDRAIYIDGIETTLEHQTFDPVAWHTLPDGAVIVFDECQRIFPVRKIGAAVPDMVRHFETHRHKGYDIFLVTQDAFLLDSHVRRLVGRYYRIHRPANMSFAKVTMWEGVPSKDNGLRPVETKRWGYPKQLFDQYKSTTLDTHKRKIPLKLWIYLFLAVLILAGIPSLGYFVYHRVYLSSAPGDLDLDTAVLDVSEPPPSDLSLTSPAAPSRPALPWNDPIYSRVTQPVEPPRLYCISTVNRCICHTQQSVRFEVPDADCRQIAQFGYHYHWLETRDRQERLRETHDFVPRGPAGSGALPPGGRASVIP